ncbi:MAG: ATP-binding cassette domain-containing protein, partial [Ferrovibrio sp.]
LSLSDYRRQVQTVFQDSYASLNPRLTIESSIAFGPQVHGVPQAEAIGRARDLLAKVGLEPSRFAGRYPHELSGGMRQRVMIALAIANRPRLLIADEPTTALDVTVQAAILELLAELRRAEGMGVVLITHSLGVVAEVAEDVVVMYAAQVVERGPVAQVFARPLHPYTRALLA